MLLILFCFFLIGAFIGFLFTLLLINFDAKWKHIGEFVLPASSSIGIFPLMNYIGLTTLPDKSVAITGCIAGFLICILTTSAIMSKLIKDRDDKDIIRIRDIFLGQKAYIEKYYEVRKKELDDKKLNIPELEKRERQLADKEKQLTQWEESLNEWDRLNKEECCRIKELGNGMPKLLLPENYELTLTKEYIDLMPSYFKDIFNCINSIKHITEDFLVSYSTDLTKFKSYLVQIMSSISCKIFNENSSDIRIHFRFYNRKKDGYEKLIAIKGNTPVQEDLTFIPYSEDSLIMKSYECKRALIKSINHTHAFPGNNHKVWKDYMTYTFYNIEDDNIPLLSFGISVKNDIRYEKLFYFLCFIRFEDYLQEYMEQVNNKYDIRHILTLKG